MVWWDRFERPALSEHEGAYLAGLIDGTGRIEIAHHRRCGAHGPSQYDQIYLVLAGLKKDAIAWLKEKFPFVTLKRRGKSGALEARFVSQSACAVLVEAYEFILDMKPYAKLVFKFAETMLHCGRSLSPEAKTKRQEVESEIRRLNSSS